MITVSLYFFLYLPSIVYQIYKGVRFTQRKKRHTKNWKKYLDDKETMIQKLSKDMVALSELREDNEILVKINNG